MACETCGEKPKNPAKDFTKAVIEIDNPETLVLLRKVVIPTSMGTEEQIPAVVGKYKNVILYYEANKHTYIYSSDGIPTLIEVDIPQELWDRIATLEDGLGREVEARAAGDARLQQELDDFKNSPDVVDIVPTYAALQDYDTSGLGDKDIIRVLADETHDGQSTYYRWNLSSQTWTYIGAVGDYYTKTQVDSLLGEKQDELAAGANITIAEVDDVLTISATDTTYSAFTGTDGQTAGSAGLVPAPATTDAGKVLGADGSWVAGGPTIAQTIGNSTTSVMSQDATSSMIFADPTSGNNIKIGNGASTSAFRGISIGAGATASVANATAVGATTNVSGTGAAAFGFNAIARSQESIAAGYQAVVQANSNRSVAIGYTASAGNTSAISIGNGAYTRGESSIAIGGSANTNTAAQMGVAIGYSSSVEASVIRSIAIGPYASATGSYAVALGANASATQQGQFDISTGSASTGYNSTSYRLLTGVHDPVNAHDAATKGYVDSTISAGVPTINSQDWSDLWQQMTILHMA